MFDDFRQAIQEIIASDWIEQICQSDIQQEKQQELLDQEPLRDWEWNHNLESATFDANHNDATGFKSC